jgi:hypothetical protein
MKTLIFKGVEEREIADVLKEINKYMKEEKLKRVKHDRLRDRLTTEGGIDDEDIDFILIFGYQLEIKE